MAVKQIIGLIGLSLQNNDKHILAQWAKNLLNDDFTQLNMRTEDKLIFDYNPSESSSWLYDLPTEESILIKSTYKDNPFLPDSIKKQIEDLKRTLANHWYSSTAWRRVSMSVS